MAGRVEGKVAFITGAARGQGRSHAVRLAQEGADIIAVDVCAPLEGSSAPPSTPDDLAETADLVKAQNRRIVTAQVDVRDYDALKAAVDSGVEQLGRLDIIVANAGIANTGAPLHQIPERDWQATNDINVTGAWKTVRAGVDHLLAGGRGGSIILTSSVAGLKPYPNMGHYVTTKHGVVGLMRNFAFELGPHNIRVNSVHPTHVDTSDDHERSDVPGVPSGSGERRTRRHRSGLPVVPCHYRFRGCAHRTSATLFCSSRQTNPFTSPGLRCRSTPAACSSKDASNTSRATVLCVSAMASSTGRGQTTVSALSMTDSGMPPRMGPPSTANVCPVM